MCHFTGSSRLGVVTSLSLPLVVWQPQDSRKKMSNYVKLLGGKNNSRNTFKINVM